VQTNPVGRDVLNPDLQAAVAAQRPASLAPSEGGLVGAAQGATEGLQRGLLSSVLDTAAIPGSPLGTIVDRAQSFRSTSQPTPRANQTDQPSVTDVNPIIDQTLARIQRGQGANPLDLPEGTGFIAGPRGVTRLDFRGQARRVQRQDAGGARAPQFQLRPGEERNFALPAILAGTNVLQRRQDQAARAGPSLTAGEARAARVGLDLAQFNQESLQQNLENLADPERRNLALPVLTNQARQGDPNARATIAGLLVQQLARQADDPEIVRTVLGFPGQGVFDFLQNARLGTGDLTRAFVDRDTGELRTFRQDGSEAVIGRVNALPAELRPLLEVLSRDAPQRLQRNAG